MPEEFSIEECPSCAALSCVFRGIEELSFPLFEEPMALGDYQIGEGDFEKYECRECDCETPWFKYGLNLWSEDDILNGKHLKEAL